ncbi:MAG: hypothetical protein R3A13_04490 [Bdellovibrionota bacterium]
MKNYPSNKLFAVTISTLSAVVIVRLAIAANESYNWKGFYYSSAHVLIVAIGTYLVLRSNSKP